MTTTVTPKQVAIKDMLLDPEFAKSRNEATERGFNCVPMGTAKIIFSDEVYDHVAGYAETHSMLEDEDSSI